MRPKPHTIACKRTLNLSSALFQIKPSLPTTHLLSLGKYHVSNTSKISGGEALRQARAKQWYDHLYTKFHTMNGYTSPTFKPLLADMARRAGHTVNEADAAANPRWDWSENNPMLKWEAQLSVRFAEDSINEKDGVRERRRNWSEESENEDEEGGDNGKATDNEDVTENRLDRYLDAVEKNAKALLEHVRVLKDEQTEEVNSHKENHQEKYIRFYLGGPRMCPEEIEEFVDDGLRSVLWQRASDRCHRSCPILKALVG